MTNKKKRWKIAQRIREYGVDFDTSHQLAKQLVHGKQTVEDVFRIVENMVTTCARGCCVEQRGNLYQVCNQNGDWVELNEDDLEYILNIDGRCHDKEDIL